MRKPTDVLLKCIVAALCLAVVAACTVVKIGKADAAGQDRYATWTKTGTGFQAAEYVAAMWEKQILPVYEKQAVDYATVLAALHVDRKAAIDRYGLKRETGEPFYVFKVRGTARVVTFDDSSRNGVIRVNLEPAEGKAAATLQVGPVVRGTVIRDSLEFIRFTDVGNQLQFAELANQLNARVQKDSVASLDLANIAGKRISFLGAFRLEEAQRLDEIVVTPVKINLLDSNGK